MESKDIVEFKDFIFLSNHSILVKQTSLDPEYEDATTNNFAVLEIETFRVKASLHLDKNSILYNLVDIQGALTPSELGYLLAMIGNMNDTFLYPKELKNKDSESPVVLNLKKNPMGEK